MLGCIGRRGRALPDQGAELAVVDVMIRYGVGELDHEPVGVALAGEPDVRDVAARAVHPAVHGGRGRGRGRGRDVASAVVGRRDVLGSAVAAKEDGAADDDRCCGSRAQHARRRGRVRRALAPGGERHDRRRGRHGRRFDRCRRGAHRASPPFGHVGPDRLGQGGQLVAGSGERVCTAEQGPGGSDVVGFGHEPSPSSGPAASSSSSARRLRPRCSRTRKAPALHPTTAAPSAASSPSQPTRRRTSRSASDRPASAPASPTPAAGVPASWPGGRGARAWARSRRAWRRRLPRGCVPKLVARHGEDPGHGIGGHLVEAPPHHQERFRSDVPGIGVRNPPEEVREQRKLALGVDSLEPCLVVLCHGSGHPFDKHHQPHRVRRSRRRYWRGRGHGSRRTRRRHGCSSPGDHEPPARRARSSRCATADERRWPGSRRSRRQRGGLFIRSASSPARRGRSRAAAPRPPPTAARPPAPVPRRGRGRRRRRRSSGP